MAAAANRLTVIHQLASALSPSELEELKLARLRELRQAIDALRNEQENRDPLLAWVIGQENGAEASRIP
jgi:hypothetical protein